MHPECPRSCISVYWLGLCHERVQVVDESLPTHSHQVPGRRLVADVVRAVTQARLQLLHLQAIYKIADHTYNALLLYSIGKVFIYIAFPTTLLRREWIGEVSTWRILNWNYIFHTSRPDFFHTNYNRPYDHDAASQTWIGAVSERATISHRCHVVTYQRAMQNNVAKSFVPARVTVSVSFLVNT